MSNAKPRRTADSAVTAIRRDRRETKAVEHFDIITMQLRALAAAAAPVDQARRVAGRYARTLGVRAGVVNDLLLEFLTSPEAAAADIEDIDAAFLALDCSIDDVYASVNATAIAAGAIARARASSQ